MIGPRKLASQQIPLAAQCQMTPTALDGEIDKMLEY